MMLAALRPDSFGPIVISPGAPLSYWQGVHGKYPMRYSGGLMGGEPGLPRSPAISAPASSMALGSCRISKIRTRQTHFGPKQYNLYSKIDTEAPRYLGFERWWGSHVSLNAEEEIQFIVDMEAVRRQQSRRRKHSNIRRLRHRSAQYPFADCRALLGGRQRYATSAGTRWILDLYENVDDIRARGQTICRFMRILAT